MKRPEFAKQSSILLNVEMAQVEDWNEAEIEKRGTALAAVAVKVWPSPEELGASPDLEATEVQA